jgi:hypothetical protein
MFRTAFWNRASRDGFFARPSRPMTPGIAPASSCVLSGAESCGSSSPPAFAPSASCRPRCAVRRLAALRRAGGIA